CGYDDGICFRRESASSPLRPSDVVETVQRVHYNARICCMIISHRDPTDSTVHAPAPAPLFRTWLFGPGADAAAHEAMAASGAHVLIQDLEDFTPPERRAEARALSAELFARLRECGARVCARINALDADGPLDLRHVVPARPDFVAYPKAATVD